MAPFFNVESGEMRDPEIYTDTPDAVASSPMAPTPPSSSAFLANWYREGKYRSQAGLCSTAMTSSTEVAA